MEYANENQILATQARSFAALAFVPVEDIEESFRIIRQAPDFHQDLVEFAAYFERTWLGTVGRPALFPPELWNMRTRTLENDPRTNNGVGKWVVIRQ